MCQVGVKLKSHLWGVNGSLYAAIHELPLKVGALFRVCGWEQSQNWEKPTDMERLYMLYMSSDTKIPLLVTESLFNLDQMHFFVKSITMIFIMVIDGSYTELKSTRASIRVISRIMSLCSYTIKHSFPGKEGKKPSILSIQLCNYLVATWGGFTNIVRIHSSLNLPQKYLA